jgi:hypothetical protein
VLAVLQDIAAASTEASTCVQASSPSDATRASRKFKSKDEFAALLERVRSKQAAVKLRKLFLYSGECNVMQEIWIQDILDSRGGGLDSGRHTGYSWIPVV